jgi:peptide/nickel transport system substrate-binding protein
VALGAGLATAILLAGCAASEPTPDPDEPIRIASTFQFGAFDPACTTAPGSLVAINQLYPRLLAVTPQDGLLEPDIAESASFTAPGDFTVTLIPGLEFANGNELTAIDVAFSVERQLEIAHERGPSAALANLASVEVVDDLTLVFHLVTEGDQAFPSVLASSAGAIVDEHTFPLDACAENENIVAGAGFAGQYLIADLDPDPEVPLRLDRNPAYGGAFGAAQNLAVELSSYPDEAALLGALGSDAVDVALHLSASASETIGEDAPVRLLDGPSGAIQSLVFNFAAQPFGTASTEPNTAKALAVRQAAAALIDREALASAAPASLPLFSFLPTGVLGTDDVLDSAWGDGRGGPDADQAEELLLAAGVTTPVSLGIEYPDEQFGAASAEVFALLQEQLEASGLFEVTLGSTPWPAFEEQRVADAYPAFQFGFSPAAPDPLAYLAPTVGVVSTLANHSGDPQLQQLVADLAGATDDKARETAIERIQELDAMQLSTIPLLQGTRSVGVREGITGLDLDRPLELRFGSITRG